MSDRIPIGRRSAPDPNIANLFRQTELQRREARRAVLLNEIKLAQEGMTKEDKHLMQALDLQHKIIAKDSRLGYWKTLWLALRGKI